MRRMFVIERRSRDGTVTYGQRRDWGAFEHAELINLREADIDASVELLNKRQTLEGVYRKVPVDVTVVIAP